MRKTLITFSVIISFAGTMALGDQSDFLASLRRQLDLYYERHVPVKIHLTFNQPAYAPGDTAFFRINFFRAEDFRPVSGRQIVNIQFINPSGQRVRHEKVLVVDGAGANQIPVSATDVPGRYTVVAYSDAMATSDPSLFFRCPLRISGPHKIDNSNAASGLRFFPEGGHLVSGITNKIITKGPPHSSGTILAGDGSTVASFTADANGLGLFFLTPRTGMTYYAYLPAENLRATLPDAEPDGAGLLTSVPADDLPIRVTVQVPSNSALKQSKLHLVLSSHSRIYYAAELIFAQRDFVTLSIPQENLPAGLARLTLFNAGRKEVAERLLFIEDRAATKVALRLPAKRFSVREQIPLVVNISRDGRPLASAFALTVYHEDLLHHADKSISDNALLYGDLSGSLDAEAFVSTHGENDPLSLDHFLITCTWSRFKWDDVWNEAVPNKDFKNYLHLAGRAFLPSGETVPDSTVISFFIQKSVMTYEISVDQSGKFDFPLLFDFAGEEEVFYRIESKGEFLPDAKIELDAPLSLAAKSHSLESSAQQDDYFFFARRRNLIDQSYSYHTHPRSYAMPPSLNALVEEEVFGPDVVINFGDYYLFPTMAETLREIIPLLEYRKKKGRDVVRLFFEDRNRYAEGPPLFVVDGVITDNSTYFLSLDPAQVASLKIIQSRDKLRTFGAIGENGIVLVETKIPDNAAAVPRSEHTIRVQGLTSPSGYHYSIEASVADPRWPDLRTNLLWRPLLTTDAGGTAAVSIRASDVTGKFRIKVEGFTEDGSPFASEETFEVVFRDH